MEYLYECQAFEIVGYDANNWPITRLILFTFEHSSKSRIVTHSDLVEKEGLKRGYCDAIWIGFEQSADGQKRRSDRDITFDKLPRFTLGSDLVMRLEMMKKAIYSRFGASDGKQILNERTYGTQFDNGAIALISSSRGVLQRGEGLKIAKSIEDFYTSMTEDEIVVLNAKSPLLQEELEAIRRVAERHSKS
jgi:hypothetical protein